MDTVAIIQIIKYLITVIAAVLLGNGAVYLFNHMPGKWFIDYDDSLPEELHRSDEKIDAAGNGNVPSEGKITSDITRQIGSEKRKGALPEQKTDVFGAAGPESLIDGRGKDSGPESYRPQRVRSTPWKYLFSMLFIAIGLYLVKDDWLYTVAVLAVCWILLELSIADIKYRIVPDQLVILLAVSAVGLIQYHTGWQDMLCGAALGLGIVGATALLGRVLYKKDAVGGGDIKLFAALGLLLGTKGVLAVFMISALISGAHMVILLASRRIKRDDTVPMVPYIAAAAAIYMIFIWPHIDMVIEYLIY